MVNMTSKLVLPFEIDVEMRAYQNKAFPFGIIKANLENYYIWLCGKLINCVGGVLGHSTPLTKICGRYAMV